MPEKNYVVVSSGKTKEGKDSSRLAAIVKMSNGNEYVNMKDMQYVDGLYPLLKIFKSTLQ